MKTVKLLLIVFSVIGVTLTLGVMFGYWLVVDPAASQMEVLLKFKYPFIVVLVLAAVTVWAVNHKETKS